VSTILVVDDEPAVRDALERALRAQHYTVLTAADGRQALDAIAEHGPDLILLDVLMPVMDGFEACRRLREAGDRTPVLILTARDTVGDRVEGLDAGADDYVVKPFALEEVLARLRALERRAPDFRATVITVADLQVDPSTRSAIRAGTPIPLTTTEYALLEFLARHAGSVLGRAEISAHVWDENYDPFSNVIDVYVARLRKKVDLPGLVPLLHTVRGAGYALDPARGTT